MSSTGSCVREFSITLSESMRVSVCLSRISNFVPFIYFFWRSAGSIRRECLELLVQKFALQFTVQSVVQLTISAVSVINSVVTQEPLSGQNKT